MKAKVFYQDFFLNSRTFDEQLELDKDNAFEMTTLEFDVVDRELFCDKVWQVMNLSNDLSTIEFQNKVMDQPFKGKHTSMSVGDYIEFEDGEIRICAASGWKIIPVYSPAN
jgi:hypothetical protein